FRCAVCTPNVDLCDACFRQGMGPEGHKKSHPYHVMDKLATPLFTGE
ncbi:unnamed protein product, partial [Scytosiphon promiscuus]